MSSSADSGLVPFPSTHWTVVARANVDHTQGRRVLGEMLRPYLAPMRSYLLARFRVDAERADDLLQSFLLDKVLDDQILRHADQARGRFRCFLIRALDDFAVSQFRKATAAHRAPGSGGAVSLQHLNGADEPADAGAPDVLDVAWARRVVELAVDEMRGACGATGRADLWSVFEGRVLTPTLGGGEPVPLDQLTRELGVTAAQASNRLATAKRMFARTLRKVVGAYAVDEEDAADEVGRLKRVLAAAGGDRHGKKG